MTGGRERFRGDPAPERAGAHNRQTTENVIRWMGIDYGSKRIGIAVGSDRDAIVSPVRAIQSTGTDDGDVRQILACAAEYDVEGIVVGLPLNMDGTAGPQADRTLQFVERLRSASAMPVEVWDERLTSFEADQLMSGSDLTAGKRKRLRDALAAQVMLQSFLASRDAGGAGAAGELT